MKVQSERSVMKDEISDYIFVRFAVRTKSNVSKNSLSVY